MDENRIDKPTGPAFAAIIAAALAAATLGLLATLAEASDGFGDWLSFSGRVGMLSGETIIAIAVYFLSWVGLALLWRRSNPSFRLVATVTAALIAAGLLGTFPLFFRIFGVEE